jgi:hypothetical protein
LRLETAWPGSNSRVTRNARGDNAIKADGCNPAFWFQAHLLGNVAQPAVAREKTGTLLNDSLSDHSSRKP